MATTLERASEEETPAVGWADRGWYLAIEYGVLARDRFLERLPRLRRLGTMKELLAPGGAIVYRNLFRANQVKEAWDLLTALRPWHERLTCYLQGEIVPLRLVHDILWCAAFPPADHPCRAPAGKKERALACPGGRLLVSPGPWKLEEPDRRHLLTFTRVDGDGVLRFEREALERYLRAGEQNRHCPTSPARHPQQLLAALQEVPVRSLGWPLVAVLNPEHASRIGSKALEDEHGFVLDKGQPDLEAHAALELWAEGGDPEACQVGLAGDRGAGIGKELRLPKSVRGLLGDGILLRGLRLDEAYVRRKGGHYDLEQRFVLSTRVTLLPTDRPERFQGYELTTHPQATPEYAVWVEALVARLPGPLP